MGTYIRRLREQSGLPQHQLAERMDCSQAAIAQLEAGVASPNIETLRRIAQALGLQLQLHAVTRDEVLNGGVPTTMYARRALPAALQMETYCLRDAALTSGGKCTGRCQQHTRGVTWLAAAKTAREAKVSKEDWATWLELEAAM